LGALDAYAATRLRAVPYFAGGQVLANRIERVARDVGAVPDVEPREREAAGSDDVDRWVRESPAF